MAEKEKPIYRLQEDHCPQCDRILDSETSFNTEEKPSPGDNTVCLYCLSVLRFDEHLKLKLLSVDELFALPDKEKAQLNEVLKIILKQKP